IKRFFGKKNKTDYDDHVSIYSKNANKKQSTFNKPQIAKIVTIIVALLIVAWVGFGFYVVLPAEQAIVLRLGKFSKLVEPGL
ncbi:FtsH protease activity modulator HflK, partial [Francisella tularensis subsp. holarctica]|nr:FtsH protease activity modulator HflK [Francisella tularensis subsp. holarctica]